MTDFLFGLASLAPLTLAGCLFLSAFDCDRLLRPLEKLALGYGIGCGILVWAMLIFHALGLAFDVIGLLVPLLGVSTLAFLFARRRHRRDTASNLPWSKRQSPSSGLNGF